jgi:hypothetical protein
MCYANQIIGGGDGRAVASRLTEAGASGVIVADLTPDEGAGFESIARDLDLAVVYLIAPTTLPVRRVEVAGRSGGFLYCVSLVGVTGARASLPPAVGGLVAAAKADSPVPVAVGFGVSKPAHVRMLVEAGADGVIVASALIDALGPEGRDITALADLVAELRADSGSGQIRARPGGRSLGAQVGQEKGRGSRRKDPDSTDIVPPKPRFNPPPGCRGDLEARYLGDHRDDSRVHCALGVGERYGPVAHRPGDRGGASFHVLPYEGRRHVRQHVVVPGVVADLVSGSLQGSHLLRRQETVNADPIADHEERSHEAVAAHDWEGVFVAVLPAIVERDHEGL